MKFYCKSILLCLRNGFVLAIAHLLLLQPSIAISDVATERSFGQAVNGFEKFCFRSVMSGGISETGLRPVEQSRSPDGAKKKREWWLSNQLTLRAIENNIGQIGCAVRPYPYGERPQPNTIKQIRDNFELWVTQQTGIFSLDFVQPCHRKGPPTIVAETREKNANGQFVRVLFTEFREFDDFMLIAAESGSERQFCEGS